MRHTASTHGFTRGWLRSQPNVFACGSGEELLYRENRRGSPARLPPVDLRFAQKISFKANSSWRMPVADPGDASCSMFVISPFVPPEQSTHKLVPCPNPSAG
jgi:hypothetical protein